MQFDGIAAVFAIVALLCLLIGYKLLSSSSWIGGWLRGNIGIICVLLTGFFALCVVDVRSYKPMFDEKTVATLSFREISPHHYEARIVDAMGIESRYLIEGDFWYLRANQFKWSKRMSLGMGHGYRFTTITGQYDKNAGAESSDVISQSHYFDLWKYISGHFANNFLVSADAVVTLKQPLADAAMYEVVPSGYELIVKPLNEFAKRAQIVVSQPDPLQPSGGAISSEVSSTTIQSTSQLESGNSSVIKSTSVTIPPAQTKP